MEKTFKIALGSGKGGVGKSTTSINLALCYAKLEQKTLLFDLDPLSNIRTILDLKNTGTDSDKPEKIFENLYLLDPYKKAGVKTPEEIYAKLLENSFFDLNKDFQIVVFDLSAGSDKKENLSFLDFADMLLAVTNPEPLAHVAAAGYINKVLSVKKDLPVYIWQNRYEKKPDSDFNPDDIFGNYNRNVAEKDKIPDEIKNKVPVIAKVPKDPALDLLQADTGSAVSALRNMVIFLDILYSETAQQLTDISGTGKKLAMLINSFISSNKNITDTSLYLEKLIEYLEIFIGRFGSSVDSKAYLSNLLSDNDKQLLEECFIKIKNNKVLSEIRKMLSITEECLQSAENSSRFFYSNIHSDRYSSVNREAAKLLKSIESSGYPKNINYLAGILLFYLSIFNITKTKEHNEKLYNFIPVKKGNNGKTERDRNAQIRTIIEKNSSYQKDFLQLVKYFNTPLMKEIDEKVRHLKLEKTVLDRNIYIKLLGSYLHDTVNSGLSIITGFPYRTASISFQKSADLLLRLKK